MTYHGSCLCKQVRYSVTGFSEQVANCHCTMCRKFHGSAFGTLVAVKGLQWLSGEELLKEFTAENGTTRTFCSHCGSSIGFRVKDAPLEDIELAIATFDEAIPVQVDAQIYTAYKANWCQLRDDVVAFEEGRDSKQLAIHPKDTIFKKPEFYPAYPLDGKQLVNHYHEFDHVFLGFLPFIKFPHDFVPEDNNYPTDLEIKEHGQPVSWKKIIRDTSLQNEKELFKATKTNLDMFREEFKVPKLAKELSQYDKAHNLYYPDVGCFDYFIKRAIYRLLKQKNLWYLTAETEFYEQRIEINLNTLTEEEFIDVIQHNHKYLHINNTKEKILFAIDYEDLYFTCALTENTLNKVDIEQHFEGFWANDKTTHMWAWNEEDIK